MAAMTVISIFAVSLLFAIANGYLYYKEPEIEDGSCPGNPNSLPPWEGTPTLVKTVANGSLYTAGNGDDQIYVLHVYGSAYSMGYAHGQLLRDQIQKMLPAFMSHVESEVDEYVKFLPEDIRKKVEELGLDAVLDLTHTLTAKYSPDYFFEEMRGLADGAGIEYKLVVRVHMLPELVKAGCSMLGAWGKSVLNKTSLLQLRALDWDTDGPLQNVPTAVVYHPDQGHDFINIGWSGWLTTISGVSSKGIAVSEKHSDLPFGKESREGIPFNFLMRDILQFDNSLQDSIRRILYADRTCSIWLGVGDATAKTFRLFEYSQSTANIFDDKNITKIDADRYQKEHCDDQCIQDYVMEDLVYWGVHLGCWNQEMHKAYGKINATKVIEMVGIVQTGNLQAVVYDLEVGDVYISNAKGDSEGGPLNAYDRKFVKLNYNNLFKVLKPN